MARKEKEDPVSVALRQIITLAKVAREQQDTIGLLKDAYAVTKKRSLRAGARCSALEARVAVLEKLLIKKDQELEAYMRQEGRGWIH